MVGNEYYELYGEYYHDECFEDNAASMLCELCGAIRGTAEEDDGYYD